MRELELDTLLRQTLLSGLALYGIEGIEIKRNNQPSAVGPSYNKALYFCTTVDVPYGAVSSTDVYDSSINANVHTETQEWNTMYQINAFAILDPADLTQLTALDLVKAAKDILESESGRNQLFKGGASLLKILSIRTNNFVDDRDQIEFSPSFDVTFLHETKRVTVTPCVDIYDIGIKRV